MPIYSSYSNVACATTLTDPMVIVMTFRDIAFSMNVFHGGETTVWENFKTGELAGAGVGEFRNLAVVPATGQAWLLTYGDEMNLGSNGIWYTPDVAATAFSLVMSVSAYRALLNGTEVITAIGCSSTGVAYASANYPFFGSVLRYLYGTNTFSFKSLNDFSPAFGTAEAQFSISSGALVRSGSGQVWNPGARVINLNGAVATSVCKYSTGVLGNISAHHLMSSGNLYSFTDQADPGLYHDNDVELVYLGVSSYHPILEDGDNVLTTRYSDGMLMNCTEPLADPVAVFGAGRRGGAYEIGPAGYGEILWVCGTNNSTDHLISLRGTGGDWQDKTGNLLAAIDQLSWCGNQTIAAMVKVANKV